jgi:DNA polymerase III epsilon subunit-like protein
MQPQTKPVELLDVLRARGFTFPDVYVALDTETTASGILGRLPVQLALLHVSGGVVIDQFEVFLNWGVGAGIDPRAFASELNKINYIMATRGDSFPITYDMVCERGQPALTGFHAVMSRLNNLVLAGVPIIGHNIFGFDAHMLDEVSERYLQGWTLPWDSTLVLDTGLFEKALSDNLLCYDNEDIPTWQKRVARIFSSTKWKLSYCIEKYGLQEKLASGMAHNAVFDTFAVIQLVNKFNELLKNNDGN